MANTKNFIAKNGFSTGDGYSMPDIRPSLLLDFANSKTLDPRITFTRGSTATYWDGHTTTKAEENLIPYSQDIIAGNWNLSRIDITDDQTAPDGTSTAQLLTPQANSGYHYVYPGNSPVTTGPNTFSVYAKNNGANYAFLRSNSSGGYCGVNFDLSNSGSATVEGSGNIDSYSATDVGNGWYRLTVTFNVTLASQTQILINGDNGASAEVWTGNGTDGIYVWGAQLENRSSATAYTPTTSNPIVKYQPVLQTAASGEARFDHDPVTGESKGLLIEEARTNIVTYSEDFSNAAWLKGATSIQADNIVAPDGSLYNDNTIRENSSNTEHLIYNGNTSPLGTNATFTMSVFAKNGAISPRRYLGLRNNSLTSGAMAVFDLQEGTVTDTNASGNYSVIATSIEDVGNGWYLCSVVMSDGGDGYREMRIQMVNSATPTYNNISSVAYTGDGVSTLIAWGAQMEIGSLPTSYIPTSGSTVTRSSDNCLLQNDFTWFNPSKSTLYAEYQEPNTLSDSRIAQIQSTDNSEQIALYSDGASGANNASRNYVSVNGETQMQTYGFSVAKGSIVKTALAIETNNGAASVNGETPQTDTSMIVVGGEPFAYLSIGSMQGGAAGQHLCSTIKKISYYPQRLSNATLQAMTEE